MRRSMEMNLISEMILISTALGIRRGPGSDSRGGGALKKRPNIRPSVRRFINLR